MGRPRKSPVNGDSKIIYDAITRLQTDVTDIKTEVASETATRAEQHNSNLRALESMSGDMHIVLSKVQNLDCNAHLEKMNGMSNNIKWLWALFTAIVLTIIGTFIKTAIAG